MTAPKSCAEMLMLFAGSLRGRGVGAERGVTVTGWVRKQFLQKNIFEIFYFLFFIFYFLFFKKPLSHPDNANGFSVYSQGRGRRGGIFGVCRRATCIQDQMQLLCCA